MTALRHQRGRLLYFRRSDRKVRGFEDFALTANPDGTLTLRCLARTHDSQFVRDVVYTLGADRRPREVFIRLQLADAWIGSGYFSCHEDRLRVTVDHAQDGRVEQNLAVPSRFHVVSHAVMLDGWTLWAAQQDASSRVEGEQAIVVYNTSRRWDGTDGPAGQLEPMKLTLAEQAEIEVPAGRFPCQRFDLVSDTIGSPPAQLWVTGPENLLVRYDWPELDLLYELDSLEDLDALEGTAPANR